MIAFDPLTLGALTVLVAAGSSDFCGDRPPVKIDVTPSARQVTYDYSLRLEALQEASREPGVHTHIPAPRQGVYAVTKGFMKGSMNIRPEVKITSQTSPRRRQSCLWYDEINVEIEFIPKIYIAREVRADRCMYGAVKEHELKHVRVDKQMANEFARDLGLELRAMIIKRGVRIGPVPEREAQKAGELMQNEVFDLVTRLSGDMEAERARRQAAIDTPEEYERVSALCPDYPDTLDPDVMRRIRQRYNP